MARSVRGVLLGLSGGFLLLSQWASGASSATIVVNGTYCVPANGAQANVHYDSYGATNFDSRNAVTVECPVPRFSVASVSNFSVRVYDFTPTANDLCCRGRILDNTGNLVSIGPQNCAPSWGSTPQTVSLGGISGTGMVSVECFIPPANANGSSSLTSIALVHG